MHPQSPEGFRQNFMQSSNTVLMVRPAHFTYNEETAENNAFMQPAQILTESEIVVRARQEFEGLVSALRTAGVEVIVINDTPTPVKPDAVFPNNWFSTHDGGRVFTYPMYAPTRRAERDNPVISHLEQHFEITRNTALEYAEADDLYLEGTGSMVLDRVNKICYLCESDRSDLGLAQRWCDLMDYNLVAFTATDRDGLPVYHTNVIMAVGTKQAVLCLESIAACDRVRVMEAFAKTAHDVILITFDQVTKFSGNMLELRDGQGKTRWAMSTQAHDALTYEQRTALSTNGPILHADLTAIEQLGGGSARCMIAEIFLEPLAATS